MNSILNLSTYEYEQNNKDFLKLFPKLRVKFRDQLCVIGHKYDYVELSKVSINENLKMTPSIFNNSEFTHELDCIGIYSIGVMEIMYMTLIKDSSLLTYAIENLYKVLDIFDDYRDVSNTLHQLCLNEKNEINNNYYEAFILAFTMKTNYNREGYNMIKDYMNIMMIIWLRNKALFWQIFFEIMDFCTPIMSILLEKPIWEEFSKTHEDIAIRTVSKTDWLDENDLTFSKIEYILPKSDITKYITDCRGLAIFLTLKFYLQFLSNYGEMNSKIEPYFDYKNNCYINYIDTMINNCIGNDDISIALNGKYLDERPQFGINGSLVFHANNINSNKLVRLFFENVILFNKAYDYNINDIDIKNFASKDISMNYFTLDSLTQSIGNILYYSKDLYGNATKQLESQINKLEQENNKILKENSILKEKIKTLSNNIKDENVEELQSLQSELDQCKELLESKQNIINNLVQKNKELTAYINNIYIEEDIEDEFEEDISIKEMINYINDFKFTLIGGRMDLVQKLNDIGWTNVIQFDNRNKSKLSGNIPISDFYVINTKFNSHKLVEKVESLDDLTETLIYYNGTNIDKLVYICYQFVKNFFNE